jgi:hypothetical protein
MNMSAIQTLDLVTVAFVFGATVWFFFVQSPVLLKRLGRERFVPIQMKLTAVLFKVLSVALLVSLALTAVHSAWPSAALWTALVAAIGGLINQFIVVPQALAAGGRSRKDIRGQDEEGSTTGFASEGAGNATRVLHRLVVLFVVVMLAGEIGHIVALTSA